MSAELQPFPVRAADAIIDWGSGAGQSPAGADGPLDPAVMTELAMTVSSRLHDYPFALSLVPSHGSIDRQVRQHVAGVLRAEFDKSPGFEANVREMFDRARQAARTTGVDGTTRTRSVAAFEADLDGIEEAHASARAKAREFGAPTVRVRSNSSRRSRRTSDDLDVAGGNHDSDDDVD